MSSCSDCVHYDVCKYFNDYEGIPLCEYEAFDCAKFKPKSRFVELPCEVGQTVYVVDKTSVRGHCEDNRWVVDEWGEWKVYEMPFSLTLFECGKSSYYLSREGAEKALAERSK